MYSLFQLFTRLLGIIEHSGIQLKPFSLPSSIWIILFEDLNVRLKSRSLDPVPNVLSFFLCFTKRPRSTCSSVDTCTSVPKVNSLETNKQTAHLIRWLSSQLRWAGHVHASVKLICLSLYSFCLIWLHQILSALLWENFWVFGVKDSITRIIKILILI